MGLEKNFKSANEIILSKLCRRRAYAMRNKKISPFGEAWKQSLKWNVLRYTEKEIRQKSLRKSYVICYFLYQFKKNKYEQNFLKKKSSLFFIYKVDITLQIFKKQRSLVYYKTYRTTSKKFWTIVRTSNGIATTNFTPC